MSPESIIYSTLTGDAEVTALVGTNIYIDEIPQGIGFPSIVYQRDKTEPQNTIHGTQVGEFVVMSVVIHSTGRSEAESIATEVESAMRASEFWKVTQESGFDDDKKLHIVALQYRYFHSA